VLSVSRDKFYHTLFLTLFKGWPTFLTNVFVPLSYIDLIFPLLFFLRKTFMGDECGSDVSAGRWSSWQPCLITHQLAWQTLSKPSENVLHGPADTFSWSYCGSTYSWWANDGLILDYYRDHLVISWYIHSTTSSCESCETTVLYHQVTLAPEDNFKHHTEQTLLYYIMIYIKLNKLLIKY